MVARTGYGQSNFFPMGHSSKIIFRTIGFSYTGKSKKLFLSFRRSLQVPWGLSARVRTKNAILGQISIKIEVYQLFKTCFSPIGLQYVVDIQIKAFLRIKISKKSIQRLQKMRLLKKNEFFEKKIPIKSKLIILETCV